MSGGIDGRLTEAQIHGLETWLAHVDPDEPVIVPQLLIDAMQALIEEVREWRAGALGADDIALIDPIRRIVECYATGPLAPLAVALLDRLLIAHGAKP